MFKILKVAASATALITAASAASAATVYAESVTADGVTCSVADMNTDRSDLCNTLGAPDTDGVVTDGGYTTTESFTSLLFDFGTEFTGPLTFWEVTAGLDTAFTQSIAFTLMNSSTGASAGGTIINTDGVAAGPNRFMIEAKVAGLFDSLLVTDTTAPGNQKFHLDAISVNTAPAVAAVPLPASAALMLVGLGAFGVARRKKSA